jgi:predicted hydrocarbon binding protein
MENEYAGSVSTSNAIPTYESFEDIVVANILNGNCEFISSKTLELGSSLVRGLGLSSAHFNAGISIGKILYRLSGNYAEIPEDKLEYLIKFFEHAGFGNVIIKFLATGFEFEMDKLANDYNFEAGIISGFLNSIYGKYFYVSGSLEDKRMIFRASSDSLIRLTKKDNIMADINSGKIESRIASAYWLLYRGILTKNINNLEYIKEINKEFIDKIKNAKNYEKIKEISGFANMIGIKNVKIIKKNPIHMRMYYTSIDNEDFVKMSTTLINYMLEESFDSTIFEKEKLNNNRYIVDIKINRKRSYNQN